MKHSMFKEAILLLALSGWTVPASPQVTVDETYTGAALVDLSGVSFPTRAATVSGESLQFLAPGAASREVLMRLPIAPAGTVDAESTVGVIFDLTFVRVTRDNDLHLLLSDGNLLAGALHRDNRNGLALAAIYVPDPPSSVAVIESALLFDGAGFPPIGNSAERKLQICLSEIGTHISETWSNKAGSADFPAVLDGTQELILVLVSGSTNEAYQIDSLRIRVIKNQICSAVPITIKVDIDIKPDSFPNSINPRSKGNIPVAILSTEDFDAASVDLATVRFGNTGTEIEPSQSAFEDVDGDGDIDIILHFPTQSTGFECSTTFGFLTGETTSSLRIIGSDSISTKGCK